MQSAVPKKKVEIHHLIPFNYAPSLELRRDNMMSLCESKKYGINCHLLIGHLGNYRRFNYNVELDMITWNQKLKKLKIKYGYWKGAPEFPLEDWQYEVANNDTRRGYWEWITSQLDDA